MSEPDDSTWQGLSYSNAPSLCGQDFGEPPLTGVFIYTVAEREGQPFIGLRMREEKIEWFSFSNLERTAADDQSPLTDISVLFELDLSDNLVARDVLTAKIRDAFSEKLDVGDHAGEGDKKLNVENPLGYSQLGIWHKDDSSKKVWLKNLTRGRLFLDFLFDLHDTKVFNADPSARLVKKRLLENVLARAILFKAQFYLALHKVRSSWDQCDSEKKSFFEKARSEWIALCLTPEGTSAVETAQGKRSWFGDVEAEICRIELNNDGRLIPSRDPLVPVADDHKHGPKRAGNDSQIIRSHGRIARWLLRRYNFDAAMEVTLRYLVVKDSSWGDGRLCQIVAFVCAALLACFSLPLWRSLPGLGSLSTTATLVVAWLLPWLLFGVIAKFVGAPRARRVANKYQNELYLADWRGHSRPAFSLACLGWLFVACLLLVGNLGAFDCDRRDWEVGIQHAALVISVLLPSVASVVVVLALATQSVFFGQKDDSSPWTHIIRLALPRLLFALVGVWLAAVTSSSVLSGALFVRGYEIVGTGIVLLVLPLVFSVAKVDRIIHNPSRSFERAAILVGTAVLLSLHIGVLCMSFVGRQTLIANDVLDPGPLSLNFTEHFDASRPPTNTLACLVAGSPTGSVAGVVGPHSTRPDRFEKLRQVKWGCAGHLRTVYVEVIPNRFTLYVFPGALLFLTWYAVFVALFLHLIAQDREMAEPL
ncbi:MAG: hypothetical protein WCN95_11335 [bacterium]